MNGPRDGNPYTDTGFASTLQRAMAKAVKDAVIPRRFTFHDPRAYYTTQAQGAVWSATRVARRHKDNRTGVRPLADLGVQRALGPLKNESAPRSVDRGQ